MITTHRPWSGLVVAGLLALAGCADPQLDELDRELAAIRADPGTAPRLELPEVPDYRATPYREADSRSPFEPRQQSDEQRPQAFSRELAPDPDRPREPLERFALGELELVGILTVGAALGAGAGAGRAGTPAAGRQPSGRESRAHRRHLSVSRGADRNGHAA